VPLSYINENKQRNIRNLKLKDFFHRREKKHDDYDPKAFKNLFTLRSTWVPPLHALEKVTVQSIASISSSINALIHSNRSDLRHSNGPLIYCNERLNNLTVAERDALSALKSNSNIVIKPADKGGAVVICDRALYRAEGLRQLLNTDYYKEIQQFDVSSICDNINKIISQLVCKGVLSDKQEAFLRTSPSKPRPFYLLPKVHKPRSKWPNPHMPEGRPIVSDCGSETDAICTLIDYFLQPLSKLSPAYIKDTYHFIDCISNKTIPANSYLISADVTALYTNMNIDLILQSVCDIFREFPDPFRPDKELLMLLQIALCNNVFEFDDRLFLQICGTAMGKGFTPSCANIYLRKLDRLAKQYGGDILKFFFRFIDDIFAVWSGTLEQSQTFQDYLDSLIPGIYITFKIKKRVIEFLDTLVYTVRDPNNPEVKIIKTRVYFKPTDTHQLLHATSFQPSHTTHGILKSQLLRFKRISHCYSDYSSACRILFDVLQHRGYSRTHFRIIKFHVWYTESSLKRDVGAERGKILPIVNYYDKISARITEIVREHIKPLPFAKDLRIIAAFKKHRSLKDILCSSRFSNG